MMTFTPFSRFLVALQTLLLLVLLLTKASVASRPNCNVPLFDDKFPCIKSCLGKMAHKEETFICDISANWLHHRGGSDDFYPATPPEGTGVHEYVAYKGTPPCNKNGYCTGCRRDLVQGNRLCGIQIDPDDCSVTCSYDETSQITELFYH